MRLMIPFYGRYYSFVDFGAAVGVSVGVAVGLRCIGNAVIRVSVCVWGWVWEIFGRYWL